MTQSRALKLIGTFTEKEFREFGLFVESPFFNSSKAIVRFYKLLKQFHPEYKSERFENANMFKEIFPNKKYNDALFRNLLSDILKLAEEFVKITNFRKSDFYSQYLLLNELTDRRQGALFKTNLKKAIQILNKVQVRDEIYYKNSFLIEDEKRRNQIYTTSKFNFKEDNLKKQYEALHVYLLTEAIKLYAIMLNEDKFNYDHGFDFSLLDTLMIYIEKNLLSYRNYPYITIFYNCVKLYKTEEYRYFVELKKLARQHRQLLTDTDRRNMFVVLTNYCKTNIRKGKYEFYHENFELYDEFLKIGAYFGGSNFISHFFYDAIAGNAVEAGKLDWAEKFVEDYKMHLHKDFSDNSYFLNKAIILSERGEYGIALELLSKVKTLDIRYRLNINHTLLKVYYDTDKHDSFLSLVEAFNKLLTRNKNIKSDKKIMNKRFVEFINRLFKLKRETRRTRVNNLLVLKKQIENSVDVVSRKWLLDRLNEEIKAGKSS